MQFYQKGINAMSDLYSKFRAALTDKHPNNVFYHIGNSKWQLHIPIRVYPLATTNDFTLYAL